MRASNQFATYSAGLLCAAAMLAIAVPAHAELPATTRAMLQAAIASGEDASVETVARFARQAQPADVAEIDGMVAQYHASAAERAAHAATEERERVAHQGLLQGWSGQGQLGASRSTGTNNNTGVTAGLALTRKGTNWEHHLRALADYQRSNGVTTQEQFLAEVSPQYRISNRLFAYGLGRWERNRTQGFAARETLSGGLGYRAIETPTMRLDLRAGPAWRHTRYTSGATDSSLAALGELDFGWQASPNLRLGQTASVLTGGGDTTLAATTSLDARLVGALSARFAYTINHETNPPAGTTATNTLSRVTLVYDF